MNALIDILKAPNLPPSQAHQFYSEIAANYDQPWRHYHTVRHLSAVAGYLIDHVDELANPRVALWAALSHDEVYIPNYKDNEERSAQMAEYRLDGYLPGGEVEQIGNYIRATAHHRSNGSDHDLSLLLDADIKILGADEQTFAVYEHDIHEEFRPHYTDLEYTMGRLAVLRDFQTRSRLFITDTAFGEFESRARTNLTNTIADLEIRKILLFPDPEY